MEEYGYLWQLALILMSTKFLGLLTKRYKMPQVVGALLAGLLLGPAVLGNLLSGVVIGGHHLENLALHQTDFIEHLSEIGVIVLMFCAGLETDINELKKCGKASFIIAVLGVIAPLIGGGAFTYWFLEEGWIEASPDSSLFIQAVFVGVVLTATSVSITVETLREMGKLNSNVGNALLGAAIIDDILGIIALSIVSSFADTSVKVSIILLKIVLYFVFMAVISFVLYKIFKNWFMDKENFKRQVIAVIGLCLLLAYISEEHFGVADITGAFVAGLIISAVDLKKEKIMFAVDDLSYAFLSPIFFVSIGLKLVLPKMSMVVVMFAIVLTIVAVISKIIGCGLGCKLFKYTNKESLQVGIGMVSRGEVALIVANKGFNAGLINSSLLGPIIIVVIATTILSPILLKMSYSSKKVESSLLAEETV